MADLSPYILALLTIINGWGLYSSKKRDDKIKEDEQENRYRDQRLANLESEVKIMKNTRMTEDKVKQIVNEAVSGIREAVGEIKEEQKVLLSEGREVYKLITELSARMGRRRDDPDI